MNPAAESAKDPLEALSRSAIALMAILSEGPRTGYQLKKAIDSPQLSFWRDSFGSIYPNLRRIEKLGLARKDRDDVGGRKRVVYTLTEQGMETVRRWLALPSNEVPIKAELLLKLRFAYTLGRALQLDLLRRFEEHQRDLIPALYETLQYLDGLEPTPRNRTRIVSADFKYRFNRMLLEWSRASISLLQGEKDLPEED